MSTIIVDYFEPSQANPLLFLSMPKISPYPISLQYSKHACALAWLRKLLQVKAGPVHLQTGIRVGEGIDVMVGVDVMVAVGVGVDIQIPW